MRILVVDEWVPWPTTSGKKIRTYNLLVRMASRHEITYLCYADPHRDAKGIAHLESRGFRVIPVRPPCKPRANWRLALRFAINLPSKTPLVVRNHYTRRFQRALSHLARGTPFELLHCEWTHYGLFLQHMEHLPRFLASHNVESVPWRRLGHVTTSPLRRAAVMLEYKKLEAFERRIVRLFDHVTAVSLDDARILQSAFGAHSVQVIPNGVDSAYYASIPRCANGDRLVFCASMDSWVNQDAVLYFAHHIFPIIREKRPGARLVVLGSDPPPAIQSLASDDLTVTGTVDDVRPWLASATACVVPLRIAGGSRLKILEAFAAGVPVVSTSVGAEGLEVTPGHHLLIADDENTFAAQCVRLLENEALRRQLADAAKSLVSEKYDWEVIAPALESAWQVTVTNYHRQATRQASQDAKPHNPPRVRLTTE